MKAKEFIEKCTTYKKHYAFSPVSVRAESDNKVTFLTSDYNLEWKPNAKYFLRNAKANCIKWESERITPTRIAFHFYL